MTLGIEITCQAVIQVMTEHLSPVWWVFK